MTEESAMDSVEELDDFSDSDSDFESTRKGKRWRRQSTAQPPPPKRPRRKAAARVLTPSSFNSMSHAASVQQPRRGHKKQFSPRPVRDVSQGNRSIRPEEIFDAVCSGKSAIVTVVDEWLDSYKRNKKAGLLVLLNFVVRSCGCKGVITEEMYDSQQNADIISTLTQEFNEDSSSYPLSSPGHQLKHFRAGLSEFSRVLVASCQNSFIYDEFLFPSLLVLLTGLSDSQVRAFRHTSTLLAVKLMTGFVDAALNVSVQLQTTQRQYDMESSRSPHDKAPDRLLELQATVSLLHENKEEVFSMMNAMFRGVFVHRYRDLLTDIRAICVAELGVWLKSNPEHFLNDKCLKYLGWTLYDKESPVRMQSVRTLQGLYQETEFIGRLELFTGRFKDRMLSMVLDKDSDVAVEALNLLLLIQQRTEEGLGEDECSFIYPLIYATPKDLGSAAGAFLYDKLNRVIARAHCDTESSGRTQFIQLLISFYMQSELHEHAAYLVDSLWSVAGSELRDWEVMTTCLLQDTGLKYEEEGLLIELMVCAMKQAAEVTPPVGRSQGRKYLTVKEKKAQEQDRRRITTHFIPLLPQLLAKYSADAKKVRFLLRAPLYFDLEMYSRVPRMEKYLDLLLAQVCGIVEKHTDVSVLEACALLVSTLTSDNYTFSSRACRAFSQLLDGLAECFHSYLDDLLQGTADDDDVYNVAIALKRLAALSKAKDLTGLNLFDSCLKVLKSRMESEEPEKELIVPALRCAGYHLMWAKLNAVNSTSTQTELKCLNKNARLFFRVCQKCLSVQCADIRDEAFELLCDLLLLYGSTSLRSTPALAPLAHLPSDSLRSDMAGFIVDYVFCDTDDSEHNGESEEEEEAKITLLQRKRNQLAGYCKLVIYSVLDLIAATDIFKYYCKFFNDFGDIIKETLSKSRLINPVQSARAVCLCLQQSFSEMLIDGHTRKGMAEIKDLAKRLANSFAVDLKRVRNQLMALHVDGISFAFQHPVEGLEQDANVNFLEILSEFSFKLLQEDRSKLANFLKSECPNAALSWPAVKTYQRSLATKAQPRTREPVEEADTACTGTPPLIKSQRTTPEGGMGICIPAFDQIDRHLLDSPSSIHSTLSLPVLTSTAQKQPDKQLSPKRATLLQRGSSLHGPESELPVRKVQPMKPIRRRLSVSSKASPCSHFSLMSLFENEEGDEDIGNSEPKPADSPLPMRRTSSNVLDVLFE
ncbi:cohesin subunit SA-1 [Nelusetta ayraudi]|uniref:cohesin subunit SA-1 n=1 Tax=Nelusetta ayraudi TaxID=303726 RepID=UPI003F72B7FB